MSGIEVRDRNGSLTDFILLPGGVDVYGLAFDGEFLYSSTDSEIYRYLGGNLWDLGFRVRIGDPSFRLSWFSRFRKLFFPTLQSNTITSNG